MHREQTIFTKGITQNLNITILASLPTQAQFFIFLVPDQSWPNKGHELHKQHANFSRRSPNARQ